MFSTNNFGQSSSSPFGSSMFGQTSNTNPNPFNPTPTPFSSFGSPTGGSLFSGMSTGVIGQPSTPLFGASPTPAFGASPTPAFGAPSTSTFGSTASSFGGSSTFGQRPAFGGFGSTTPTQTSPFGSTTFQQTQPSFGSNTFGSTLPFGGTSQPAFGASSTPAFGASSTAFGASSTPAFGNPSTPSFGSLSTPAFGTASTPAFGATSTPAFGASSTPAFGSTSTPAFGSSSSLFGSTGTAFGVSTTPTFGSATSAFGAPSASSFGVPSTPAFGASAAAFGASSSPSFGFSASPAFAQSTSGFGSTPFGATPSPFGQGSAFGGQTASAFGSTGFGQQSPTGGQQGGSRVFPYAPTPEVDGGTGTNAAGKVDSISAMPVYKDKTHEELRWEDYQRGDKGGPSSAATQGNLATGAFGQGASNNLPFSTSNQFGNRTTSFGSTGFGLSSTTTNPFGSSSPSPFGSTSGTPPLFGSSAPFSSTTTSQLFSTGAASSFSSTPSFFTSSIGTTSAFGTGLGFPNTQSSGSFQSSASPFGQTMPLFSQSTGGFQQTSSFPSSSLFNNSSTGGGLFSNSTLSLPSSSSSFGFNQATPSAPTTFLSGPTTASGPSLFGSYGQTQPAFSASSSGFGSISNTFSPNTFIQPSANQPNFVMQPTSLVNPFGTLPIFPQMSVGRVGSSPSIQYGISSMPDVEKPISVGLSTLAAPRHMSRRIRVPARKYHPKPDEQKVAFFMDDDDVQSQSTPKADACIIPRDNPRALVVKPIEQWPPRIGFEKPIARKEGKVVTSENGKLPGDTLANGSFSEVHEGKLPGDTLANGPFPEDHAESPTENGHFTEQDKRQEGPSASSVQKPNGFSNDHAQRGADSHYRTISGHRAGEAAIVYEHGADIEALMPKLRHDDYYTEPRIQELAAKERAEPGFCRRVKEFMVGRHGFGSIKFDGETDVRRLELESIIQFNHREVLVYNDKGKKPPVGQGLNKPAEVTLLNIKCINKKTGQQYTEGPRVEKFKEILIRKAQEQGAEFVSYDPVQGEWKFRVKHFNVQGA